MTPQVAEYHMVLKLRSVFSGPQNPQLNQSLNDFFYTFQVSSIANNDGEVTKEEFLNYARHSEFFKTQMDKTDSDSMAHKQEAIAKAERAFKLFDKDNDGYLSCFQTKIN